MSLEELQSQWIAAERAAVEAELEIAKIGQASPDPAAAELFKRAADLRAEADRIFRLLPKN